MSTTADVTGGKPIAVLLHSISGVSAINPSVTFYDTHGGKREVLFFYFLSDTTRDIKIYCNFLYIKIAIRLFAGIVTDLKIIC
jgi:hypothetical protein